MAGVASGARGIGRYLKETGLDKIIGAGIVGTIGVEATKYGVINPVLERAGIKPPSYTPPPAMSGYEEILLGQQKTPGFLGFGGQQGTQGLIEKRALQQLELERMGATANIDQMKNAQVMANRLAMMQINANSPLELTRTLADRDRYSSSQNALASISSSMGNAQSGYQSSPSQIGYSQTGYAQSQPIQTFSNPSGMSYQAGQMMARGRKGKGSRYGVDASMPRFPGMPQTQELREAWQISPEQMGQFSGRGGAIARGFDSAKYGYVDNSVPMGAEEYAMGGYGPTGQGRRRGRG